MKQTKIALKNWFIVPLSSPSLSRKDNVDKLAKIQIGMENCDISLSQIALEREAQYLTSQAFRVEEEHLRLKSRSIWLKAGDRNSAFFHRQCRARLSRNHISEITNDDGVVIKGKDHLKQAAYSHFQKLFQDDGIYDEEVSKEFLNNVPSLVSNEENIYLMRPFLEREIVEVIWAMGSDKAPGPHGYSIHFFKVCWPIIKSDLLRMILAFQRKVKLGGCTN